TFGISRVVSFISSIRSSTENNGCLFILFNIPTITSSKTAAPLLIISKCPIVIGSKLPEQIATFLISKSPLYSFCKKKLILTCFRKFHILFELHFLFDFVIQILLHVQL